MNNIQLDMFEVQLGAAVLLQFATPSGSTVRVLADAGVKASGYPVDHVHARLAEAFASFGNAPRRLDLVIGTHYDEDHLGGLVPIINDTSIEIGEAWLPPVANDMEMHALEESVQDRHLLANQFAAEDGETKLDDYLRKKRAICEELRELERTADDSRSGDGAYERKRMPSERAFEDLASQPGIDESRDLADEFRAHLFDANLTLGLDAGAHTHADDELGDDEAAAQDERDVRHRYPDQDLVQPRRGRGDAS